ncbi:MAG: type II toxin-antitoxin system prevent-host-death family antitoxin [Gallionellaceae bacterium]|nr:type II toxin-antitoxin system prevent-host-death family antitoxin [Gallionellaceae bacterium]
MQYNIREAKNQFSKLVQAVLAGRDVVIARSGSPVVRLVKINTPDAMRKPGAWAGLPKVEVDWVAPVSRLKDSDLQKAPQALLRASERARQLAEQTGTTFVVRKSVSPAKASKKE